MRVPETPPLLLSGGVLVLTPRLPEPNATFRVGADGETGACKGLTLSNSSPVLFKEAGAFP